MFLYKCAGSGLAIKSGKKIESESFTLKTNRIFCAQTTPEKFKRATIVGHFEFVFEENSVREIK